ncbi:unnamed protein product [Mytilus coruscus]|uniref:Uncharacterized protein n=1 Tax=Mytilus coruscus TaxID=42192 RepID=A0A6J8EET3_MYTCO|nr:unnamed protein product [Mytilus coruscus]
MQTLASTTQKCKSKCSNFLQQFNIQEEKLIKLKDQVLQMKEFASDQQVFLGTRQIDKLVMSEIESVKASTDSVNDYKFNLVLNSDIQKLSNGVVKEFGKIQVTEHITNLDIKELKIEQAQMQQSVLPRSIIADVELKLVTKLKIKNKVELCLTDCAILSNGHLLFANYTTSIRQYILEYSEEGNFIGRIKVSASPHSITVLDSDTIVISYGYNRFFEIFNYRNSRIEKRIDTGGPCCGLSQSNGKIYVIYNKVGVFDITGKKERTLDAETDEHIFASKHNSSVQTIQLALYVVMI